MQNQESSPLKLELAKEIINECKTKPLNKLSHDDRVALQCAVDFMIREFGLKTYQFFVRHGELPQ